MSKDIKVGDLVMVTKISPCCGRDDFIGTAFTVNAIEPVNSWCGYCGKVYKAIAAHGADRPFNIHRLIKIDPPFITESETESEKLAA